VNVTSAPRPVPASLVATRRKWYVVPDASDPTVAETFRRPVPEPAPTEAVLEP
jgi:hypothetical protein